VDYMHDGRVHDGRVYSGSVEYTRRSCPYYVGTTVVSVTSAIYKRNFLGRSVRGLVGGANNCTTCENPTLADLAVLGIYQQQDIDHLSV